MLETRGARRGREVEASPTENARNVVLNGVTFPELYKMRKVLEDGTESGETVNFPFRFLYVNFNPHRTFAQMRKNLPLAFLISFRIIKDFH